MLKKHFNLMRTVLPVSRGTLCLIFILFISTSFQTRDTVPHFRERLDKLLSEKINDLKEKKYKECQEKLLKRANEIADSTLIAEARKLKITPVDKPPKPPKPEKPELMTVDDSTALGPLFREQAGESGDSMPEK